jgi:hypothetical protein
VIDQALGKGHWTSSLALWAAAGVAVRQGEEAMTLLAAILVALIIAYDGRVPLFAVLGGVLVGMGIEHVVQARARRRQSG